MMMNNDWQNIYHELRDFISKNQTIELSPNAVVIPGNIRTEFYRLFDMARVEFIKGNFPAKLEQAYELSKHWTETSNAVIRDMQLESIDIEASLRWFLTDPINGLMRSLFDPLFDLLKNKITLESFEQIAMQVVEQNFIRFFRAGYQRWAETALIKLLKADKIYSIPAIDYSSDASAMEGDPSGGLREEGVPEPVETSKIVFETSSMCSFLAPRIILHSTVLNHLVAFRPDFYEARWKARLLSDSQEWFSIRGIENEFGRNNLWPDLAIYISDDIRSLMLVADHHTVARPDIIVDFQEDALWYEREGLDKVKRHYDVLKPKSGMFVICREAVPETTLKELEPKPLAEQSDIKATANDEVATEATAAREPERNIHIIVTGYEDSALKPVIEVIPAESG
jgi:hypothetical protein